MIRNCPICTASFKTYPSVNKVCCSRSCSDELKKRESFEKYKQTCEVCEVVFMPPRPAEGAQFCSYKCRGIADRLERVDRQGYWYVCLPDHPNCSVQGYVPEHVLVMEKHIGRYLEADEVVHHIDHDKKNNVLENLQLMTDSEHKSLHARQRARSVGRECRGRFV